MTKNEIYAHAKLAMIAILCSLPIVITVDLLIKNMYLWLMVLIDTIIMGTFILAAYFIADRRKKRLQQKKAERAKQMLKEKRLQNENNKKKKKDTAQKETGND